MSSEEVTDSWYLHSQGRRFGPLTEDELRSYFGAGMVKVGDLITMPGQPGTTPAEEVAALLGASPPVAAPLSATASAPPATHGASTLPAALIAATIDLGKSEARGSGALPIGASILTSERSSNFGWVAPVLCMVALAVFLYAGLVMLRRMQAQVHPSQTAAAIPRVPEAMRAPANAPETGLIANAPRQAIQTPTDDSIPLPAGDQAATTDVWLNNAERLARDKKWSELLAHTLRWSAAEPPRDMPWLFMGMANAKLGRMTQAVDALKHILATDPSHAQARALLADIYLQNHQFQNAASLLQDLVNANPNDARLWNNYGNALFGLNRFDEAAAALETAVRLEPTFRVAWNNLGNAYELGGHHEQAAAAFAKGGGVSK
jgi:hypothetical protein